MEFLVRKIGRPRFSLRSLILFVMLAGSGYGLWVRWEPWRRGPVLEGHSSTVYTAAYSPDAKRIVTAGDDHTARIWDAATGKPQAVLKGHLSFVLSASFSPDGKRIVTASPDKTARVWDTASGMSLTALKGHSDSVWSAAYSPYGTRIVTGSYDKTACVWDAATGKSLLLVPLSIAQAALISSS